MPYPLRCNTRSTFLPDGSTDLEGTELNSLDQTKNRRNEKAPQICRSTQMHAYKDAIRRSGGAYILYPGATDETFRGFHEIIPGLGAFSVNPSPSNADIKGLSDFIDLVIDHLLDRTSQREKLSDETYHIFKVPKEDDNVLHERIPEYVDKEKVFADEVAVLIGFYKNEEHLQWILKNNLYNFRTGTDRGSLPLSDMHLHAKYLILHGKDELETKTRFFKLTAGPRNLLQKWLLKRVSLNPEVSCMSFSTRERCIRRFWKNKNRFKEIDPIWDIQKFGQTVLSDFIGSA